VYASLGNNSKSRLAVTDASMGRAENAMAALLGSVKDFTYEPKFQVNWRGDVDSSITQPAPDLKTVQGSVQSALSLVIDRITPNAPAQPKELGLSQRRARNCGRHGSAHIGDFRHAYRGFQTWLSNGASERWGKKRAYRSSIRSNDAR
jgi:hypothetical protein